jgi:tight adherence protein C
MPTTLLAALAGALAGVALLDAAVALVAARAQRSGDGRGRPPGGRRRGRPGDGPGAPPLRRAVAALLVHAGRRAGGPRVAADLTGRLAAAGHPGGVAVEDVAALKAGAALAGLLAAGPLAPSLPGRLGAALLVALPAAGFLAPDLWLRRLAAGRGRAVAAELPDVLDLLRVAVDAGLPASRALAEVGRRRPGLLAAELRAAAARTQAGQPRAEALALLQARCPAPGVVPLVAALGRAERHGAPLGPVLAALAADARALEAQRVRDRAARAAPRIQLAVALLLVPAVMLLVAAALLAGLT